jgi:glycosyltransferase involved in cell wall biosynthesis
MKITLLIPTIGQKSAELAVLLESLNNQRYKNFEAVVISQANHDDVARVLAASGLPSLHLKTNVLGLSHARNIGLRAATGDIVTLSDDDCWYPHDGLEIIARTAVAINASVFCFQIFDPIKGAPYKAYRPVASRLNRKSISRVSSIEIAFRRQILSEGLRFDTNFGLGAPTPSGEENVFLSDVLRRRHKVMYVPEAVVYHRSKEWTVVMAGRAALQHKYRVYQRMNGTAYALLGLAFFMVKHRDLISLKSV